MNSDTLASIQTGTGKRSQLLPLTALGTAETIFTMGTDTGSANAFVSVPLQTGVVGSSNPLDPNGNASILGGGLGRQWGAVPGTGRPYYNSSSFDCRPFLVTLSGRFTTSAVDSATGHAINLYQNTSAALGGNLLFSGITSATLAAGNYSFFLQATLIWDSVSQTLSGESFSVVGGGASARGAIAPISVTSPGNLLFVASTKFNTGAANTITPVEFSISQI
jgi:hypothetical protein